MTARALAWVTAALAGAPAALAEGDGYSAPSKESWGVVVAAVVAVVAAGVIIAVAFKNARRTHLD